MKIYKINETLTNVPKLKERINLCLGYFDGVHIAHQRLINASQSASNNPTGIITFLGNIKPRECLTSLEDRLNLFKALKVDYVFILPFTSKIKNMTHITFKEKFFDVIKPNLLLMGSDYTFGKNRLGNAAYLKKHYKVEIIPDVKKNHQKISANLITQLIKDGEIKKANAYLGRPYEVKGKVVVGFKHGAKLGFPTANVRFDHDYVMPRLGVYKAIIYVLGVPHLGIANVGVHPTVNKLKKPILEVHIPLFKKNLYHQEVYVEFLDFIRPEKKFKSEKELKAQIKKDLIALKA